MRRRIPTTEQLEGGDGFLPRNDGLKDQMDSMVIVRGGVGGAGHTSGVSSCDRTPQAGLASGPDTLGKSTSPISLGKHPTPILSSLE